MRVNLVHLGPPLEGYLGDIPPRSMTTKVLCWYHVNMQKYKIEEQQVREYMVVCSGVYFHGSIQ